jgi:hypothetical protein
MEGRRRAKDSESYRPLRRGWCVGDKALRGEVMAAVSTQAGAEHYGAELRESGDQKAERLVTRELRRKTWQEADLERQAKGHSFKVALARRLRMGTRGHAIHWLYWQGRRKPKSR